MESEEIGEKKEGEPVDEKGAEAEAKEPGVYTSSPKMPREEEEREQRRTSPRKVQEASPSSVDGRLDQDDPPSDPRLSTSTDDCECPRCRGTSNGGLVSPGSGSRSLSARGRDLEDRCQQHTRNV